MRTMQKLSNGINFSARKPGKAWEFYQNRKGGAFGVDDAMLKDIETNLYIDGIEPENARIYITKEGNTTWTEIYIKK